VERLVSLAHNSDTFMEVHEEEQENIHEEEKESLDLESMHDFVPEALEELIPKHGGSLPRVLCC